MSKINLSLLLCSAALLVASTSFAGQIAVPLTTITNSSTTKGDDVGYGGLKWTMGDSWIPEVVAGYRHAEVSTNGDTQ